MENLTNKSQKRPGILVVDDRPENLVAMGKILAGLDAEVIKAASGNEALKKSLDSDFALAIVDVQMPGMDGYELVELWRGNAFTRNLPVIFVSAIFSDIFHHMKGYEAGAIDFLSKPFEPEILLTKVNIFLKLFRQRTALEKLVRELAGRNQALEEMEAALRAACGELEMRVEERTSALASASADLQAEMDERRRAEAEKRHLEAQLIQQQKLEAIGTLASGVAHEINNPVNGIMNYAQLIIDRLEPDSPLVEYAGEIILETQRVSSIVRNLLTFARQEKQHHSPAKIADIVSATLVLIRTVIRHDQISISVRIPDDLPRVRCRSQQIQQVFMNLLTNARDALNQRYPSPDENKAVHITAQEIRTEEGRFVRTTVEDFGAGIRREIRARLFDPFFTTKPTDSGTGLGLSISYGIVREHDGRLLLETEAGQYTRFHVDLPPADDDS